MSYWVAVVARNAAQHLRWTIDSLLSQTLQPQRIIVVDDGSTDGTGRILSDYAARHPALIEVLTLPNRGYDIRRVPSNINMAWRVLAGTDSGSDYFMISGDDCGYPSEYTRLLIKRMRAEPSVVVASGKPSSARIVSAEHSPSGSGRMISCSFWRSVGSRYPEKAGWETWVLYKALEKGYMIKLYEDLCFEHVRPRGAGHQFAYWGAAMYGLGYHSLYAIGRIGKNMMHVTPKAALNMFRGYVQARLGSGDSFISPFEPALRRFVRREQSRRIGKVVRALL